jgi:hypothetical protein
MRDKILHTASMISLVLWFACVFVIIVFPTKYVMAEYMGELIPELVIMYFALGWILPLGVFTSDVWTRKKA